MIRLFGMFFTLCVVSFYFFPISFTFFPEGANTKMILAAIGILLVTCQRGLYSQFKLPTILIGATSFAVVFSFVCLIAVDYNRTDDYSYVTYFVSFFTWLGGAYTVCAAIRAVHRKATLKLLISYSTTVCVVQCILAILIDRISWLQILVDTYVNQGQDFFQEVDRLYGIGAALDSAGVRFAVILLLIVHLLCRDDDVRRDRWQLTIYISAFFIISILGNMVSRTTSVGLLLGPIYMIYSVGMFRLIIQAKYFKLYSILGTLLVLFVGLSAYFYNHDPVFYENIRFAFEGFFHWVEMGKWETGSTTKLVTEMWVWPDNLEDWLIGTGLFGSFVYGTDIGYCRFILYCGLSGFLVFVLFFVYNTWAFARKFPSCQFLALMLLSLSFIIWIKVATDLFLIYALFYCLDGEEELKNQAV